MVILCEDQQQEVFARYFFLNRGFEPRDIRVNRCPMGRQAGEQYVREQFSTEVQTYRSKSAYQSIVLVVIIDADNFSVADRVNQLETILTNHLLARRDADEKIALFIPRRNIETWIHYLQNLKSGIPVDEETSYPKLANPGECKPYVRLLSDSCRPGLREDAPPSLVYACEELQKVL